MNKRFLSIIILFNLAFSQHVTSGSIPVNGEKYTTGEDGVVRMYINVWGHVKTSGTFLIFEGADIVNALSIAGGPLDGANLKKIKIISKESGKTVDYNIDEYIKNKSGPKIKLYPYDTIIVNQTKLSRVLARSSLVTAIIQLVNLLYTIDRLD